MATSFLRWQDITKDRGNFILLHDVLQRSPLRARIYAQRHTYICNMKRLVKMMIAGIISTILMQGCDALDLAVRIFEENVSSGTRRCDVFPQSPYPLHAASPDTSIIVTALEYPEGYDWKSDTLRGDVPTNIVLFLNGKRHLTVDASPDGPADPDNYCIIDGDLYSFKTMEGKTLISRNGSLLTSLDRQERIRGCVKRGGDLWTLGAVVPKGVALRQNGSIVFESAVGTIHGHISDWQNNGYGALCEDSGEICFFYVDETGGRRTWHLVRDSADHPLPGSEDMIEAFLRNGVLCTLSIDPTTGAISVREGSRTWSSADKPWKADPSHTHFIREHSTELLVLSRGDRPGAIRSSTLWGKDGVRREFSARNTIISNGERLAETGPDEENGYDFRVYAGELSYGYTGCYTPGRRCVLFREGIYTAITLRDGVSFLSLTGIPIYNFRVNGFLTGLFIQTNTERNDS